MLSTFLFLFNNAACKDMQSLSLQYRIAAGMGKK